MRSRTVVMVVLAVVGAAVWALHFVPQLAISSDVGDFFGGLAIGTGIGAGIVWFGERASGE